MSENNSEKLYEYELITYEIHSDFRLGQLAKPLPRKYSIYRLTEAEAHIKNQGYAFNGIPKRFVRIDPRIPERP